ncbi:MAG: hypothetical protein PVI43_04900 [Candidatus Bathyarchaeota archaeon]|jgi:hypothetical protein
MKNGIIGILTFVIIALLFIKCEEDSPTKPNNENGTVYNLTHYDDVLLKINNYYVYIDSSGAIGEATLFGLGESVGLGDNYIRILHKAGLWVGAYINGVAHANIIWVGSPRFGNFIAKSNDRRTGIYYVDPGILAEENFNGLIPYGFPSDQQNQPRLLGDAMCWSALETDTSANTGVYRNPIPNLRVSQALYSYMDSDLDQVFFLQYEIENRSSQRYDEVHVGFYSDTDLLYAENATGYDSSLGLSYTYSPQDSIFYPKPSYVTGFTLLETPLENGNPVGVGSHRIMRKDINFNFAYGERFFNTPEEVLYALKGLSNFGNPMVNPTNSQETKFAFTGDPVAQTGWLDDIPNDVRSLLSSAPFTLASGERKRVSIVWVVESGQELAGALANLKSKIDNVKQSDHLWKFD